MPKTKPHTVPLEEDLAKQLLNSSGITIDGQLLGDALHKAADTLAALINQSSEYLDTSEFADMVADNLAKKLKRRGLAKISVSEQGRLILTVSYDEELRVQSNTKLIPKMKELRSLAKSLGVDITPFGIKRRAAYEHLKAIQKTTKTSTFMSLPSTRRVSAAAAPPSAVQQVVEEADEDKGPMSAGPDETRISPFPDDPSPPKKNRGFIKTSEAMSSPVIVHLDKDPNKEEPRKPSRLQKLVEKSKEVDINDLLNAEAPE
jgi:hypothetical protein